MNINYNLECTYINSNTKVEDCSEKGKYKNSRSRENNKAIK